MILALGVSAVVALVLASDIVVPSLRERLSGLRPRRAGYESQDTEFAIDPGRERRAEQTARELLRSCVTDEEAAMYKELGFIRVWSNRPRSRRGAEHAYLIYAHRPIIAYEPLTGQLIGEYCVTFPDETRPYGSSRLPDADDVLAKWMMLTGDERTLLASSNMHLPGRQVPASQVTRDLWRLSRWEQARMRQLAAELQG